MHAPRVSAFDKPLPSARAASIALNEASGIMPDDMVARVSEVDSQLFMQVGQMLDHDFARSPVSGTNSKKMSVFVCFFLFLQLHVMYVQYMYVRIWVSARA